MEFMVWQLRHKGAKLPREHIEGPHRGWLRIHRLNVAGEMTLHAGLYTSSSRGAPLLIHHLHHVEIRKLDERGMLLLGLQCDPYAPPPKVDHRQAWFCQPVPPATSGTD